MAELVWDEEFFLMRWEIFHMLLAGGNNLVQKERMMQKREEISLASERLRRNRTQYTSWGVGGRWLVRAMLLQEKQRMWIQM